MSSELLEAFKSEVLLEGTGILEQIGAFRHDLSYKSDGSLVSYVDLYASLAKEVDALPKLKLDLDVAPGTESRYSVQLVMGMEQIADGHDRVLRKVILFESKLRDAVDRLDRLRGEFGAWYALAAATALQSRDMKLSSNHIKNLANSEFSRLVGSLDITLASMVSVIVTLEAEIREDKRTQQDKYAMGKDQVNVSWTSNMPLFNGGGDITKEKPDRLVESGEDEETEEDDMPRFVSHKISEESPSAELKGTFFKTGEARPSKLVKDDGGEKQ